MILIDPVTHSSEHPAVVAWHARYPESRVNIPVSILKTEKHHSAVYRLEGAGPTGGAVIAKRCEPGAATVEREIYENLLPFIPVSAPRYFGQYTDRHCRYTWLFLEDAGDESYANTNREHRELASRWLGLMHVHAADLAARLPLPDRGPLHYRRLLKLAVGMILENAALSALSRTQRDLLSSIVQQLRRIDSLWDDLYKVCTALSPTLVHCDFASKNMRLRHTTAGCDLLPFDWEHAGYGLPVADLELVVIGPYLSGVQEHWPSLTQELLGRLCVIGRLLRIVNSVYWASRSIASSWEGKIIDNRMLPYHAGLDVILKDMKWL